MKSARCHAMSFSQSFSRWVALGGLLLGLPAWAFPKLVDFAPRTGGPGITLTLTGTGLGSVTAVAFSGGVVATIVGRGATFVQVIVPLGVLNGPINVSDVNGFGDDTGAHGLPDFLAPPRISGLERFIPAPNSPADGMRGAPGNTVRIAGANFNSVNDPTFAAAVAVGFTGVNGDIFVVPASAGVDFLDAIVPVGAVSGPLTAITRIGRVTSVADFFLQPYVTRFTTVAAAGQSIEIVGISLKGASTVLFGDFPVVPKTVSSTNLTVVVPPLATTTVPLTVITPGGAFLTTTNFNLRPTITGFSPPGGAVGTSVTLTGTGFAGTTKVRFGLVDGPVLTVSATQVTTKVPLGAVSGPLTVFTPVGTNATSVAFFLPPKLTSASPNRAKVGAQVTLVGTGLVGLTNVSFGGVPATFSVVNDQNVLATVPVGAVTGTVLVSNPGGTNAAGLLFTVIGNEPVIESFSPESGGPGTAVNLVGFNFSGASGVDFGSSSVPAVFTIKSDSNMVVTVPNGATTGTIAVRNAAGTGRSLKSFTVGTNAAMSLTLSANPAVVLPAQPLVLQVQVRNTGPLPAAAVTVTVTLPDGLDYVDSTLVSGTISLLVDGFTWAVGSVGVNQDLVGYIRLRPRFSDAFAISALAKSTTPDPNLIDNQAQLTVSASQPTLRLVGRTATRLTFGWPLQATNYFLQHSVDLGEGLWSPVTDTPLTVLDELQVEVPITGRMGWYRLGPP